MAWKSSSSLVWLVCWSAWVVACSGPADESESNESTAGGGSGGDAASGTGGTSPGPSGGSSTGGSASGGRSSGGSSTGGSAVGSGGSSGGSSTGGGEAASGGSSDGTGGTGGSPNVGGTGGGSSGGGGAGGFSICSSAPAAGTPVASIYVIGDSTASVYASNAFPRMGWGQVLGESFASQCAVVKDKALSGRSSKSFFDEGAWAPIEAALVPGDFVVIQFGHNDEKSDDPTRFTQPQTTYKEYLTTYVEDARSKQAIPVLATSINRNQWSGTTLKDTHGAYPPAVRELAEALNVPLVDLTALTKTYFERIGPAATNDLFMNLDPGEFPNYPNGNADNTHLREEGARAIAKLFTLDAYTQQLSVAANLKAVPSAP
jgi:lysophospholipase L1-like esterase